MRFSLFDAGAAILALLIPMRGNEVERIALAANAVANRVTDPHEG